MTTKDNGGPAFPHTDDMSPATRPGMTLRDWFAGQAMQGLLARGIHYLTEGINSPRKACLEETDIAVHAYEMADAMLAERNKQ